MDENLIVKENEILESTYDFNGYLYRIIKCSAATDDPFDMLVSIEETPEVGNIISVSKCKIVRIDYDLDYVRIAVRIDKFEVVDADTQLSKYFTIPFIGMVLKNEDSQPKVYGPDKINFIKVKLQMRDADKQVFSIFLLGFNEQADYLDSIENKQIILGTGTLKHKNGCERYELALVTGESYNR